MVLITTTIMMALYNMRKGKKTMGVSAPASGVRVHLTLIIIINTQTSTYISKTHAQTSQTHALNIHLHIASTQTHTQTYESTWKFFKENPEEEDDENDDDQECIASRCENVPY